MLSPRWIVVWPTRTPFTSVMELSGPGGITPIESPISLARGRSFLCIANPRQLRQSVNAI